MALRNYEKQDKLIGIKVTGSAYKVLEEMAKKFLPEELKKKPGNKVNQYVKLVLEDHIYPYELSKSMGDPTDKDYQKQVIKLEDTLKGGLKRQEEIYNRIIDLLEERRSKIRLKESRG
jgi:hypothetical protein